MAPKKKPTKKEVTRKKATKKSVSNAAKKPTTLLALSETRRRIFEESTQTMQHRRPKTLFHYTDLNGLIGIVKSGALWATDIFHMNDSAELSLGTDQLRATVDALVKTLLDEHEDATPAEKKRFVRTIESAFTKPGVGELFVTCFCDNGDLLSQWRGYGSNGGGVAIGFDPRRVERDMCGAQTQLMQCSYDPKRQRKAITTFSDRWFDQIRMMLGAPWADAGADKKRSWFSGWLRRLVATKVINTDAALLCARMKHKAFEEEKEYRILADRRRVADVDIQFRPSSGRLIPYVMLQSAEPASEGEAAKARAQHGGSSVLPILELKIGPNTDQGQLAESVKRLLLRHGYTIRKKLGDGGVEVSESPAPYRG